MMTQTTLSCLLFASHITLWNHKSTLVSIKGPLPKKGLQAHPKSHKIVMPL